MRVIAIAPVEVSIRSSAIRRALLLATLVCGFLLLGGMATYAHAAERGSSGSEAAVESSGDASDERSGTADGGRSLDAGATKQRVVEAGDDAGSDGPVAASSSADPGGAPGTPPAGVGSRTEPAQDTPADAAPAADRPLADLPLADPPRADAAPATALPIVDLPVADVPTAVLPSTELPAAVLPAADLPVAALPIGGSTPTTAQPLADLPLADLPLADVVAPVVQATAVVQPIVEQAVAVTNPVVEAVTNPVVEAVTSPVVEAVTSPVGGIVAPVVQQAAVVVEPLTTVVAPVVGAATDTVEPVLTSTVPAIVIPRAGGPVVPLLDVVPAPAPAFPAPSPAPAVGRAAPGPQVSAPLTPAVPMRDSAVGPILIDQLPIDRELIVRTLGGGALADAVPAAGLLPAAAAAVAGQPAVPAPLWTWPPAGVPPAPAPAGSASSAGSIAAVFGDQAAVIVALLALFAVAATARQFTWWFPEVAVGPD